MERGKYRTIFASLAGGLWMLLVVGLSLAQEAKPAVSEPPKAEAPAAASSSASAQTAHIFHRDK